MYSYNSQPNYTILHVVEREFRREAIRQFPQLESFIKEAKIKCGHRPYVSDGILLLGRVDTFDNLLVSW